MSIGSAIFVQLTGVTYSDTQRATCVGDAMRPMNVSEKYRTYRTRS